MRIIGAPKQTGHYPCPPGFNGRLRTAYRWFSGRPMNGHRYTDATGLRHGTMATDISGHASTYQLWPGWKRFAVARFPLMAIVAIVATWPFGVAIAWPSFLAMAIWLAMVAIMLVATAKDRGHRKAVVEPLAMAMAKVLGKRHVAGHGHEWVAIPRNFRDVATVATVQLPATWPFDKGEMARVERVAMAKLGDADLVANWQLAGEVPYVEFYRPEKPPILVPLADAMCWACSDDELLLGMGTGGRPVNFSLKLESPHIMLAAGSGAGKSELLAFMIGQLMRRGYGVAVLDAKFVSHMWLRQVPGVLYASEDEELHEALVWLREELSRRARWVAAGGDPNKLVPLVVVMEEMNTAADRLRQHWGEVKPQGVTGMSPALRALRGLASMGRELRVHVFLAGQSLTSNATGGPEARESFAGRALSRVTVKQWRMLAPQIKRPPMKNGAIGHWNIVVGDELREFQAPFSDLKGEQNPDAVAELIKWATGGRPVPDVPAMMLSSVVPTSENETVEPPTTDTITLSEFVATRPNLTLAMVQKWRERESGFPAPVGEGLRGAKLYDPADLDLFVLTRQTGG